MRRRLAEILRGFRRDAGAPPAPRPARRAWWIGGAAVVFGTMAAGGTAFLSERSTRAEIARAMTGGEPDRAPEFMRRYGCGGCHTIPGLPGADGKVGPALEDLRSHVYIGGVVRNTPRDLGRWLVDPRGLSPKTAMPATGITEAEARDVAAWLYAQ